MSYKCLRYCTAVCLLSAVWVAPVKAAFYSDVAVEYLNVKIDGKKLHPWNGRIKLGKPLSRELAIEAHYASAIQDDEINGLKLEVSENMAAYARYQSPDTYSGMVMYLIAGYAWTTIETSGAYAIPEQEFESFSWGIGIEERAQTVRNMGYSFQYTRYYDNDGFTLEGFSLGVRYDF
ncbi:MAG TPA: outer membrane beta-barrel protein [Gammaproteobacteria bacterium]